MTHEEVKALVEEMGLPYAYDHFAEGESLIHRLSASCIRKLRTFGADNLVYHHFNGWTLRSTPITKTRIWKQILKKS